MNRLVRFGFFLISAIIIFSCSKPKTEIHNKKITLSGGWTFYAEGDNQELPAEVPGSVHIDLLKNKKIPQPFYRCNEKKLQWIDKKNWIYTCRFSLDSASLSAGRIYLSFKGLDTYAEVELNGRPIIDADNMFRTWEAEAKELLVVGENVLQVRFISPITIGLEKLANLGYPLPAANDQSENGEIGENKISMFTRKAPYHFGWDWGPRFVTIGIWRPVELIFINKAEIKDVFYKQTKVNKQTAKISAILDLSASEMGNYEILIRDNINNKLFARQKFRLTDSVEQIKIDFEISNPTLWWPNGYGKPDMYSINSGLYKDGNLIDEKTNQIGIREIKVITKPDSVGKSFYFEVNGEPVYVKGSNYIPNDNFLSRVDKEKYEMIIKSAFDANMNMLRVWGGGIYEEDIFYDLCDKYGILVWQDFMFACAMYPGGNDFIENVRLEAIDNVKRLRNHPSIALWCGNNEMDAAWCNENEECGWGWKKNYSSDQRREIWTAYDTIFHKVLPKIIADFDETGYYWPSSPVADWGKSASYDNKSGDMHYWGVWHGSLPFESFKEVVPRFMSEYGFQSFPEYNTIKEFTLPQDWDIYSEVMLDHQRSPIGNQKIKEYMQLYYPVPDNFKDLLYVGQLLQAYGINEAIETHRINKPYCMGTLYWQLNDCWPGPSWSGIDYYGNWKALHYTVKEIYKPTAIVINQQNGVLNFFVVNDNKENKEGYLKIKIIDFYGKQYFNRKLSVTYSVDKSSLCFKLNMDELKDVPALNSIVLVAELYSNSEELIDKDLHYFVKPREYNLPKSIFVSNLTFNNNEYRLELKATSLIKDFSVSIPGVMIKLSDNYFDLLPGETKTITFNLMNAEDQIKKQDLVIQTLNDIRIDNN